MKKTLVALFLFCAFAVQSQTIFTQGYLLVDSNISVFANAYYKFDTSDSLLYLPSGLIKVDSFNIVDFNEGKQNVKPDMGLVMFLHDGSVAKYYFSDYYGEVFTISYKNGRLVLWTKQQNIFEINTN